MSAHTRKLEQWTSQDTCEQQKHLLHANAAVQRSEIRAEVVHGYRGDRIEDVRLVERSCGGGDLR